MFSFSKPVFVILVSASLVAAQNCVNVAQNAFPAMFPEARYLRIDVPGKTVLTLGAIQAIDYTNTDVARGTFADASSADGNWNWSKYGGVQLIQGRTTAAADGSIQRTLNETNPWVRIDLLQPLQIAKFVIYSVDTASANNLIGAVVTIRNHQDQVLYTETLSSAKAVYEILPTKWPLFFPYPQRLRITIPRNNEQLSLAGIQMIDLTGGDNARGKQPSTSSFFTDAQNRNYATYGPQLLTAGNTDILADGTIQTTKIENNPFALVDLWNPANIQKIIIHNRGDSWASKVNGANVTLLDKNNNILYTTILSWTAKNYTITPSGITYCPINGLLSSSPSSSSVAPSTTSSAAPIISSSSSSPLPAFTSTLPVPATTTAAPVTTSAASSSSIASTLSSATPVSSQATSTTSAKKCKPKKTPL